MDTSASLFMSAAVHLLSVVLLLPLWAKVLNNVHWFANSLHSALDQCPPRRLPHSPLGGGEAAAWFDRSKGQKAAGWTFGHVSHAESAETLMK